MTEQPDPSPVPEPWKPTAPRVPVAGSAARNEWQTLVGSAPVYAEKPRYRANFERSLPQALRSPLRTGELRFSETGIHFDGMETRPSKALQNAVRVFFSVAVMLQLGNGILFVTHRASSNNVGQFSLLASFLFSLVCDRINDQRRAEVSGDIPWEDVYGANIDEKLRWISLVYATPDPAKPANKPMYFLTLNRLEPAMVAGVADTISHYVPTAIITKAPLVEWTTTREIVYGCLGSVVLIFILMTLCTILSMIFHR